MCATSASTTARRRRVAFSRRRDRVAQFAAVDDGRPARKGRPDRLLDLYLHQLAAHPALCPRMGREIQESGSGRDRRAHARVRLRARRRQRSPRREGHAGRLSDRDRQRLCDMECLQQRLLAGPLFRRCAGTHSPSSIRRGRLRTVGKGHSAIAGRGRSQRRRPRSRFGRCPRRGSRRRLGQPEVPENYVGYERTENFVLARRRGIGQATRLRRPGAVETQ